MKKNKSHIGLFLFMVYFLSFTMHAMPSMALGEFQIKKECPNKKSMSSSEFNAFHQSNEHFEKSTDNTDQEDQTPVEISICPTSSAYIRNHYKISFSPPVFEKTGLLFAFSYYKSPALENLQEPPQVV